MARDTADPSLPGEPVAGRPTLPGPFYEVRPRVAFGWTSHDTGRDAGAGFHATATRWTL